MTEFASWKRYWEFSNKIRCDYRYIHDETVKEFFKSLIDTCEERKTILSKGTVLWRVQLGHDWEDPNEKNNYKNIPIPYPANRMKPLINGAAEGRINPKGIPYLYLATDENTAMAEVRPWVGSVMTIGKFKTTKDLTLIDLTFSYTKPQILSSEPEPNTKKEAVWFDIAEAFSIPITNSDNQAEYTPTQVIAELFKANGFDGIKYRSTLGEGSNIAIFNIENADLVERFLGEARKITYSFSRVRYVK